MSLEFKQLLASDLQIPSSIRSAIEAGNLRCAGKMLMADFGLDCSEVSSLLDVPLCGPIECGRS